MEKYHDHPNRDRLIAREMGWTWIEEMLDAEAEFGAEEGPDEVVGDGSKEPELHAAEMEEDRIRHPLVDRLIKRSATLVKLAGERRDNDLEEMVGSFMAVGPKIAGGLGVVWPGRKANHEFNGFVVFKLKHAFGEVFPALHAAGRLKQKKKEIPFPI